MYLLVIIKIIANSILIMLFLIFNLNLSVALLVAATASG